MRKVLIPPIDWSEVEGRSAVVPVVVDWPELRLTEEQIVANAVALANGQPAPFPNLSIFDVEIERPMTRIGA